MAGATFSQNEDGSGNNDVAANNVASGNGGPTLQDGNSTSDAELPVKRRGHCKWFNVAKGWGFITPDDGGQDVFVHQSVIKMTGFRSLSEGEAVEFMCKTSDRGLEATHVSGVDDSECEGSSRRPASKKNRKIRCYNCGKFGNHLAAKCDLGPQPKRCHICKSDGHLLADCPYRRNAERKDTPNNDNNGTNNGVASEDDNSQTINN